MTGFVDLRRPLLLDVVPGRSATVVADWLERQPAAWLTAIDVVALDPHRGYANGLLGHLDHATVVIDHFHSIKLAHAAIDDVRRRVQQDTLGHRGRKADPLYRIPPGAAARRSAPRPAGLGPPRGRAHRWGPPRRAGHHVAGQGVPAGGVRGEGAGACPAAPRRLLPALRAAEVPELTRLAKTISAWEDEVLSFHTTHLSNGPTEAMNLLIKKIKRVGHDFRNLANYRLRLLLHCGVEWEAPRAARLRGRPRSVA